MIHQATDDLIAFLNEALAIDHDAVAALVKHRVRCNEAMGNHPTIQCWSDVELPVFLKGVYEVSMLGLLNGFCGTFDDDGPLKNFGPISAVYDDGKLVRFQRTVNEASKSNVHG